MTDAETKPPRATSPTTEAELERSIRVLWIAVAGGIATIIAMMVIFVAALDAPAVPLIPIAALVIVIDIAFVVAVTRQRRRTLAQMRRQRAQGE